MASIDWEAYRREWPHTAEGVVWLQHAGITPLCRRVMAAGVAGMEAFSLSPQAAYRPLWFAATDGARAKVAGFLGTAPSQIALVKNTSQGVTFVAESFPFAPGDSVVTLAGEYPANRLPWRVVERRGVTLRTVAPDPDGRFSVDRIAAAIDATTRLVAVSWVQYLNGFRVDLPALAEICRRRDAFLVVDAVQGVGLLPVPLEAADSLAVGGHKWVCGTEGAGFLYLSPRLLARLTPFNVSWHSVAEDLSRPGHEVAVEPGLPALKAGAERFEEGTPNAFGNVMLGEAVTMLGEIGPAALWARVRQLQDYLIERLTPRGYRVLSSLRDDERSGIMAIDHPAHDPAALVRRLAEAGVIAIHRGPAVRLSPHFYNNPTDMDRVAEALP
jgi:selenocysteine lyase/cysteine desulfurase